MTDDAVPWWLWPNVLALDAPAVAVVWQRFLGGAFGVSVPATASVVLGLIVWGIYLLDRRLDASRPQLTQPRHVFARRNPSLVAALGLVSLVAATLAALELPATYFAAGGVVAGLVTGYLALVHLTRPALSIAKEPLVGLLFAAGVSVPILASNLPLEVWLPAVVAFGLLCWLNCDLIDRWETRPRSRAAIPAVLSFGVFLASATSPAEVRGPLVASATLLLVLHTARRRTGTNLARLLADVVLLTPLAARPFS